tara:strand:- start:5 stop:106 length:102 start_codon:yes stop_codon:yes gene_type:complete
MVASIEPFRLRIEMTQTFSARGGIEEERIAGII